MVATKYLIFPLVLLGMLAVTDVAARKKGRRGHRPAVHQGYPLPIHQQNYVSPSYYGPPISYGAPLRHLPAPSPLRQLPAPVQRPSALPPRPVVIFGVGPTSANQVPQAYSSYTGAPKPSGQFLPQLAYIPPPTAQFPLRIQPVASAAPKPVQYQPAPQIQPARPHPKPVQQAHPAKPQQYPQPLPIKPIYSRPSAPSQAPVKLSYQSTPAPYSPLPTPVPIPAPETVQKPADYTPTWPANQNEGPLFSAYGGKLPDNVPVYISPAVSTVYGSAYVDPSPSKYPAVASDSYGGESKKPVESTSAYPVTLPAQDSYQTTPSYAVEPTVSPVYKETAVAKPTESYSSPTYETEAPVYQTTEKQSYPTPTSTIPAAYSAPQSYPEKSEGETYKSKPKSEASKPTTPSYNAPESYKKAETYSEKPTTESYKEDSYLKPKGEESKPVSPVYSAPESYQKEETYTEKSVVESYKPDSYSQPKGEESKPTYSAPESYEKEETLSYAEDTKKPEAGSYESATTTPKYMLPAQEYSSTTSASKYPEPTSKPYKAPTKAAATLESSKYSEPASYKAKSAPTKSSSLPAKASKPYVRPDSKLKPYSPPTKATTTIKPSEYATESTTTTKKPTYASSQVKESPKSYTAAKHPESSAYPSSATPTTTRPAYKPPTTTKPAYKAPTSYGPAVTSAPRPASSQYPADNYDIATSRPVAAAETSYVSTSSPKATTRVPQVKPTQTYTDAPVSYKPQTQVDVTSSQSKPVQNTYQQQEDSAKYPVAGKPSSVEPVSNYPSPAASAGSEYVSSPSTGNSGYDAESLASSADKDPAYNPNVASGFVDEAESEGDYSAIPGEPDIDYPIFSELPKSQFNCSEQSLPGYYADVSARCQVFHVCWEDRQWSFLCPNGTIFSQEHFVCVWWYEFDCSQAPSLYNLNEKLYQITSSAQQAPAGYEQESANEQKVAVIEAPTESEYSNSDSKNVAGTY